MPKELKVGTKIKLIGEIVGCCEKDDDLPFVVTFLDGDNNPHMMTARELSHAELISEPVTKKPSERITKIFIQKRKNDDSCCNEELWIDAILEYLDAQDV